MPAGRPTKLTDQIQNDLCSVIAAGNYLETACAFVGVTRKTVRNWMKEGARQKRGRYAEFLHAIKRAMAQAEISDVATIKKAAADQWQAAAWRLERKSWRRWGKKDKLNQVVSGPDGGPVEMAVADMEAVRAKRWAQAAGNLKVAQVLGAGAHAQQATQQVAQQIAENAAALAEALTPNDAQTDSGPPLTHTDE